MAIAGCVFSEWILKQKEEERLPNQGILKDREEEQSVVYFVDDENVEICVVEEGHQANYRIRIGEAI